MKNTDYAIAVVGAGWAGLGAACSAARMLLKENRKVILLTHNIESIGVLSCNPSIGRQGAKDLESLGSGILLACDKSSIQTKILGKSGGPALWSTRAQLDRQLFKAEIRKMVESHPNLHVFQQEVDDIIIEGNTVKGVKTKLGINFMVQSVILTTGTFLNGKLHTGLQNTPGGRAGDPASTSLAARMKELNLTMGRLKTGTPPRLDGRTVDYTKLTPDFGDGHETGDYAVFSNFGNKSMHPKQIPNWITRTNEKTHDIFRASFDESPMFNKTVEDGITGNGPRYCMSLETKISRFGEKNSHQIVLEPEGLNVHEIYPNGISTSLPYHAQLAAIRSIEGLENAHITAPGYAVEYDFYHPNQLNSQLETHAIKNLHLSGALVSLSGYIESNIAGTVAGINAALNVLGKEPWTPSRKESYMGVLVDDIISKIDLFEEPYRLFTARAENRLYLREDNADQRLTPKGRELGLVGDEQWKLFNEKQDAIALYAEKVRSNWVNPTILSKEKAIDLLGELLSHEYSLQDLMKRPGVNFPLVQKIAEAANLDSELQPKFMTEKYGEDLSKTIGQQIHTTIHYAGYVDRQKLDIEKQVSQESTKLPTDFDYNTVPSLSSEVKEKLNKVKPDTIGQASRVAGVTPSAIGVLLVHLKKQSMLEERSKTKISI